MIDHLIVLIDCIDLLFDCGASNALLANCGNNTVIGAEPGAYTGISDKDCEDMQWTKKGFYWRF